MIDMIGQELKVNDYVVSYNSIYQVKSLGKENANCTGSVRIMLFNPSKTTRSKITHSLDVCKVDTGAILFWILKEGN